MLLLARLSGTGLFDGSIVTRVGGPYGLSALFVGLSLAAALKLVDSVIPFHDSFASLAGKLKWLLAAILAFAVFAYLGVPAATLITDIICVALAAFTALHLALRTARGSRPARALLPSAVVFTLTPLMGAFTAFGVFGVSPLTPDIAGGFAAAGAVLLTLAMAAGEGVGVLSFVRQTRAAPPRPVPASAPAPAPPPVPHAALEAIGASHQGVFELDLAEESVVLSREASNLIGLGERAGRMRHAAWMARIHPDDRPVYAQAVKDFGAEAGLAFRIEFRARHEDGRYLWFELRATMKGREHEAAERCVGLLADITTRKESEAAMMDRTLRDSLTGLGNKVALMEVLEGLGARLQQSVFALIDIDRFKTIHASLGDAGGDAVLLSLAKRLNKRFGAAEIFRLGGDSFGLLVENEAEAPPAEFGAAVVAACGAPCQIGGRSVYATVSAGIAEGRNARDPLNLINNAELALRQAKRQGGNTARVYAPGLEALAPADAVELEANLRRALEAGEIELFYQPIVRLADRSVAGFEALLRWRHPTRGIIEPADFIAHSEESGLIVELGRFALKSAAQTLAGWQRYFPLPEALFVSVNVSRRQLRDPDLEAHLAALLKETGAAPGTLMLEITESAVAAPQESAERFQRLRALGLSLAIDDFGIGLSSLSQLSDMPFDAVKIDRSFLLRSGGTDPSSSGDVVLSSIVSMAHELHCVVVVEGVESEDAASRMTALGCELGQGFLFAEPMALEEAVKFIARTFQAPGAT
jgi:diguanylate cyclase (GGDEF)-like protein/PAS domain S-box-containing protein